MYIIVSNKNLILFCIKTQQFDNHINVILMLLLIHWDKKFWMHTWCFKTKRSSTCGRTALQCKNIPVKTNLHKKNYQMWHIREQWQNLGKNINRSRWRKLHVTLRNKEHEFTVGIGSNQGLWRWVLSLLARQLLKQERLSMFKWVNLW